MIKNLGIRISLKIKNYKIKNLVLILIVCTSVLFSCSSQQTKTLTLHDHQFTIELAMTEAERERGLMLRESLPDDHGMLFIFQPPEPVNFWMKNTLIPLDLLYFDAQKKLVQIFPDTPPCRADPCPVYPSNSEIKYVLELAAGTAKKIDAEPGVDFFQYLVHGI